MLLTVCCRGILLIHYFFAQAQNQIIFPIVETFSLWWRRVKKKSFKHFIISMLRTSLTHVRECYVFWRLKTLNHVRPEKVVLTWSHCVKIKAFDCICRTPLSMNSKLTVCVFVCDRWSMPSWEKTGQWSWSWCGSIRREWLLCWWPKKPVRLVVFPCMPLSSVC